MPEVYDHREAGRITYKAGAAGFALIWIGGDRFELAYQGAEERKGWTRTIEVGVTLKQADAVLDGDPRAIQLYCLHTSNN